MAFCARQVGRKRWIASSTRLADAQEQYGRDAVGVFGGGSLTNEKAYLLGKFARVALRTSQIDYNGRFCMSSAAAASIKAFGIDRGLPFPLADIPNADTILLVGSNLAETMPPVMQYFQQTEEAGRVADCGGPSRDTDRCRIHAAFADYSGDRCRAGQRAAPHRDEGRVPGR